MSFSKKTRLSDLINWRIKVYTIDNRAFVGNLLSFDKHMNVILGDCEERRIPKRSLTEASKNKDRDHNELRRNLGLIILRGSQIINVTIEGPGPQDNARIQRPIKQAVGPSKNFGTKGGDNATLGGQGIRKPDNGRNPTSRPFGRPGQRGPPPKRTH